MRIAGFSATLSMKRWTTGGWSGGLGASTRAALSSFEMRASCWWMRVPTSLAARRASSAASAARLASSSRAASAMVLLQVLERADRQRAPDVVGEGRKQETTLDAIGEPDLDQHGGLGDDAQAGSGRGVTRDGGGRLDDVNGPRHDLGEMREDVMGEGAGAGVARPDPEGRAVGSDLLRAGVGVDL